MKNNINIEVKSTYLETQSNPQHHQYVYSYTITIINNGEIGAQLRTRHWIIQDENNDIEEVVGEGVVGYQPHLMPGERFQYTSGAVIKTATGSMKGSYSMINDEAESFIADIPEFILSAPYTLH